MDQILNLKGVKKLSKENQKNIKGGEEASQVLHDRYICYCGFVGGSGQDEIFTLYQDSIQDALTLAAEVCFGQGATCTKF